jgi:predicted Zn-dependent protease
MKEITTKMIVCRFFVLFSKILCMTGILMVMGLFFGCTKSNPQLGYELYLSGLEAYSRKEFSEAEKICREAFQQDTGLFQAELLRIKSLFFLNDVASAETAIKKLIKKVPQYTDARLWYIRFLIFQEKITEAAPLVEAELAFNETDWRIHYLKGVINSKNQDYSNQLLALQQAERALADGAKVYLDMTRLWMVLGMEAQAEQQLEKARVLTPSKGELRVLLETLEVLANKGEVQDAV